MRIKDIQSAILESSTEVPARCPYCDASHIIHHGRTGKGSIRYRCTECRRTFCPDNLFVGSQLDESQWMAFIECYVDELSTKEVVDRIGVTPLTARRMRKRMREFEDSRKDIRKGPPVHGTHGIGRNMEYC